VDVQGKASAAVTSVGASAASSESKESKSQSSTDGSSEVKKKKNKRPRTDDSAPKVSKPKLVLPSAAALLGKLPKCVHLCNWKAVSC